MMSYSRLLQTSRRLETHGGRRSGRKLSLTPKLSAATLWWGTANPPASGTKETRNTDYSQLLYSQPVADYVADYVLSYVRVCAVRRSAFCLHPAQPRSSALVSCRTARWTPNTGCHGNQLSLLLVQTGSRGIWVVQPHWGRLMTHTHIRIHTHLWLPAKGIV